MLYCDSEDAGLLSGLPHDQQLQAAILADMWQVPDVGEEVADMLAAAADLELSAAVTERLLSMQAVPECLEWLLERVLVSQLGNLEAVWADDALRELLLGLPLHAMEVLLSYDKLKVGHAEVQLASCGSSHNWPGQQKRSNIATGMFRHVQAIRSS
jgi:hypothetical protein